MAASSPPPLPPFSDNDPPHAVPLALPAPLPLSSAAAAAAAPTPPSRRLPPPCWTPDETVALIDSYRDKWYSLRRGNLKATHWQEVADAVSLRCPSSSSAAKTAVQCRHKMEKLRKRYRTEIQRSRSIPSSRFTSSWAHFARMDAMEKGPTSASAANNNNDENPEDSEDEDNDEDQDQELYEELRRGSNLKSMSQMYRNGVGIGSGGGFRIRIPTGVSVAQPGSKAYYPKMDQKFVGGVNSYSPGPSYGSSAKVMRECGNNNNNVGGGRGAVLGKRERERDAVGEMVSAIKALGDGFVRTEQTKMEMAREIESMRMEMEMKRTEMILESQQQIVESFAKAVSEKRKKKMAKRMPPSPEA